MNSDERLTSTTVMMETKPGRQDSWFAAGGVAGAILASSCCILPLLLVILGVSGTWIGSLTVLEPFKPYVLTVTFLLLGAGFWRVYWRPVQTCVEGTYCARPLSTILTKTVLWLATLLGVLAASIDYWGPLLY